MSKALPQTLAINPEQLAELQKKVLTAYSGAETTLETPYWYFTQLGNLFDSIICLIGDKDTTLSKLAETGSYLASDWAGFFSRDSLSQESAEIKALIQTLGLKPGLAITPASNSKGETHHAKT